MPRLFNELVFDEYIEGTSSVYSSQEWNALLGSADKTALHAISDTQSAGSGNPSLSVQLEVSGDGRNFTAKNGTAEINGATITVGSGQISSLGTDAGTTPSLGFARLKVTLGGSTPKVHVRIYACGRTD